MHLTLKRLEAPGSGEVWWCVCVGGISLGDILLGEEENRDRVWQGSGLGKVWDLEQSEGRPGGG